MSCFGKSCKKYTNLDSERRRYNDAKTRKKHEEPKKKNIMRGFRAFHHSKMHNANFNAVRFTRYLDAHKNKILISKNNKFFTIPTNNRNKNYNPVATYVQNPSGKIVNIRNNTPLPKGLRAVKGNYIYDKQDVHKISPPIVKSSHTMVLRSRSRRAT